jgi:hypothetical protein
MYPFFIKDLFFKKNKKNNKNFFCFIFIIEHKKQLKKNRDGCNV